MRLAALLALMACAFGWAPAGAAELDLTPCGYAAAPVIPDGTSATDEEMAAAGTAVRVFMQQVQDALSCLESVEQVLGEAITTEQQAQITQQYNAGVDALNATALSYNQQVQAFKAR